MVSFLTSSLQDMAGLPALALAQVSTSAWALQPLLNTRGVNLTDYDQVIIKEAGCGINTLRQKCKLAFSWVAGALGCFAEFRWGSQPQLNQLSNVILDDGLQPQELFSRGCQMTAHSEPTFLWCLRMFGVFVHISEMQVLPWEQGALCCLVQCQSSRKSTFCQAGPISLDVVSLRFLLPRLLCVKDVGWALRYVWAVITDGEMGFVVPR